MKRSTWVSAIIGFVLVSASLSAQGPYSAQIQQLLNGNNYWRGSNTFNNVVIDGSCTGCGTGLAPSSATFITQTPNASLSAEQALSELSSGFLFSTTATGVVTSVSSTGSDAVVLATSPTLVTPVLGVPQSVTLTNGTGLPIGGLTGLGTGVATWLATPSSANLRAATTDETGTSGGVVFAGSPTLVTPNIGVATADTMLNIAGNVMLNQSVPTLSANFGVGATVVGKGYAFRITAGSSPSTASLVVTYPTAFANNPIPYCVNVTSASRNPLAYTLSTTTIQFTASGISASDVYACIVLGY